MEKDDPIPQPVLHPRQCNHHRRYNDTEMHITSLSPLLINEDCHVLIVKPLSALDVTAKERLCSKGIGMCLEQPRDHVLAG